jgi:hypothetical protein
MDFSEIIEILEDKKLRAIYYNEPVAPQDQGPLFSKLISGLETLEDSIHNECGSQDYEETLCNERDEALDKVTELNERISELESKLAKAQLRSETEPSNTPRGKKRRKYVSPTDKLTRPTLIWTENRGRVL